MPFLSPPQILLEHRLVRARGIVMVPGWGVHLVRRDAGEIAEPLVDIRRRVGPAPWGGVGEKPDSCQAPRKRAELRVSHETPVGQRRDRARGEGHLKTAEHLDAPAGMDEKVAGEGANNLVNRLAENNPARKIGSHGLRRKLERLHRVLYCRPGPQVMRISTTELRILDVCANRAAEALRTLEDLARFALEDAQLTTQLKELRHTLAQIVDTFATPRERLSARDAASDTGASVTTPTEQSRRSLGHIAAAAGARLSQALRTLEEVAKLSSHESGCALERVRFAGYDLSARVIVALESPPAQHRLCVLMTESICAMPWERVVELAIEGGADALQLREKGIPDREHLAKARRLVEIASRAPTKPTVYINDRVDIALRSGADGVHLGQDDLSGADARAIAGGALRVGVSTANILQARDASTLGVDLCGLGPMFPSSTKPKANISGVGYLREYLADPACGSIPHLAISGITPENIGLLAQAGCRGVAVSSVVCNSGDPAGVCRALLAGLEPARADG